MNHATAILLGALLCAPVTGLTAWPDIPSPEGTRVESLGEQIRLNGVPMRIHRVVSAQPPDELAEFYRMTLGSGRAEANAGDALILAQARGDHFITVKIRALALDATEVLLSMSDMAAARHAARRPLGFTLPADSEVFSDMDSVDAGRHARLLVFANRHSIDTNQDFLTRELAARDLWPDGPPLQQTPEQYAVLYRGRRGEAQLTLVRADALTHVVLTLVHD